MLITGATGTVGKEVIRFLVKNHTHIEPIAAVRDPEPAVSALPGSNNIRLRTFDFENENTYRNALKGIDLLFLLRPPSLTNIEKVFKPLLTTAKEEGIQKVVFLSVQGAENSTVIPHSKIESLIRSLEFEYIFLRPGYFMQNLTSALLPEIQEEGSITLPAGSAGFNWIDAKNIGETAAHLISDFTDYSNQAVILTGSEKKNFEEVAGILSHETKLNVRYRPVNPFSFYSRKRKEGLDRSFALIMTLIHFLPRITKDAPLADSYQKITGKQPTLLREFIARESDVFDTASGNGDSRRAALPGGAKAS